MTRAGRLVSALRHDNFVMAGDVANLSLLG